VEVGEQAGFVASVVDVVNGGKDDECGNPICRVRTVRLRFIRSKAKSRY